MNVIGFAIHSDPQVMRYWSYPAWTQAAQAERKGEVVMLALSLIDSSAGEPSVLVSAEIIRALRTAGLPDAARAFARESARRIALRRKPDARLTPPPSARR